MICVGAFRQTIPLAMFPQHPLSWVKTTLQRQVKACYWFHERDNWGQRETKSDTQMASHCHHLFSLVQGYVSAHQLTFEDCHLSSSLG